MKKRRVSNSIFVVSLVFLFLLFLSTVNSTAQKNIKSVKPVQSTVQKKSIQTPRASIQAIPRISEAIDLTQGGRSLIILKGQSFGNRADGRSIRLVRSNTAGDPVMSYFLSIQSWSNDEIIANMPDSLANPSNPSERGTPLNERAGHFTAGLYSRNETRWLSNEMAVRPGTGRDGDSYDKDKKTLPVKIRAPGAKLSPPNTNPDKVDTLIKEILRARNLEQVRQTYTRLRFSKADDESLAKRLSKDNSVTDKLERLGRPTIEKMRASVSSQKSSKGKSRQLLQSQQKKVQQLSAEARRTIQLKPKTRPVQLRNTTSRSMVARAFQDVARGTSRGDIDGVSPLPAIVGESVIISGGEFGGRQGEVFFLYEPDRAAFPAQIRNWSERRIEVSIPDAAVDRVGESQKRFLVRVIPDGADLGPVHDLLINPAPARLEPQITRIVPASVMPGQELTILGRNFLTEGAGNVTFVFGGERISATVERGDWQDNTLIVRLPSDISGLIAQNGRVVVENHLGNTATFRVHFDPILEETTLHQDWSHDCWGLLGIKENVTHHDFILSNQWQVVESRLYSTAAGWFSLSTGTGGGCIERRKPGEGSPNPSFSFEGWCNALNIVWCDTHIDILGPRGTSYR